MHIYFKKAKEKQKMKSLYFTVILILMFSLLLMPLLALKGNANGNDVSDNFRVFIAETAEINNLSAREYSINVATNNLEKNAHEETIKAEIVASFTKALYYKNKNKNLNFDIDDITDGYVATEKIKEKFGAEFNTLYNRFCEAADEVFGKKILYNNTPILAERHKASSGVTEDAKNLLSGEFPYLVSVESAGDLLYENHISEKKIDFKKMKSHLKTQGLTPSENPNEYFKITKNSSCGNVLKINLLGKEFSGEEIKNIFNLPSACFNISFKDDAFLFTVKGEGSFLGLSRVGAEYMAQNGSSYTQILSWYYPGCVME